MSTLAPADAPARRSRATHPALLYAGLFLAAALISGFTLLRGLDIFDEGLMLQAARRISAGQMPYRDFLCAYGPGQPYLLAGLHDLFGLSLLTWRIVRVLTDAGVALVVFAIARREAGTPLALAGWLGAACFMAQPRSGGPTAVALLTALGAIYVATGRRVDRRAVAAAAVLTALTAAFRLDFGIYAGAAVLAGLAFGRRRREAALYAAAASALTLLVYLPFAIAIGPADLYQALVGTSLRDHDYWTLPFPVSYHGGLGGLRDVKDLLDFYVPLLALVAVAVAVATALIQVLRRRGVTPVWPALAVLAAGALAYLLSRADDIHTTPLLVVLAALLPLAVARARAAGPRWIVPVASVLLALLALHGVWNRASALVRPPDLAAIDVPVADGVEGTPADARAIPRMVTAVQRRVPPGRPIYVASRRSDLVRYNNPLVYVLTERDNPTSHDFGLDTGAAAQASIVATLTRVRPRAIVRWTDPASAVREPNLRGRPSGVHTLDDFLRRDYRLAERDGYYDVLVPR